jgi:hypothetical protein
MTTDEEVKRFLELGREMLVLYEKFPQNGSVRKIICAEDDKGLNNNIMFFQGSRSDGYAVQELLNKRQKH